jgi:hypothetical protein
LIPRINRISASTPFFCSDLLHHFDFEIALGDKLLQPGILLLQLLQAAHIVAGRGAKLLAPRIDRLLADLMTLGDNGGFVAIVRREISAPQRFLIRLTSQDRHHLLVGKP